MADRASSHSSQWSSPYTLGALQPVSSEDQASYRADLKNNLFPDISFELLLDFTTDGNARIRVDEVGGLQQRFNEAADWTLVAPPTVASNDQVTCQLGHKQSIFVYGHKQNQRVVLEHSPLKVTFERDGSPQIVLNERGLFNMEHFRIKPDAKGPETDSEKLVVQDAAQAHPSAQAAYPHFLPDTDEGMWEEKWKKWTDTKPKGPESLSMDITFPGFEHVMGIPEHSGPMSLRTTRFLSPNSV